MAMTVHFRYLRFTNDNYDNNTVIGAEKMARFSYQTSYDTFTRVQSATGSKISSSEREPWNDNEYYCQ